MPWQVVLELLLNGLKTRSVNVVSSGLGNEVGVGPGEVHNHLGISNQIDSTANEVSDKNFGSVSDGLDKWAQDGVANGD